MAVMEFLDPEKDPGRSSSTPPPIPAVDDASAIAGQGPPTAAKQSMAGGQQPNEPPSQTDLSSSSADEERPVIITSEEEEEEGEQVVDTPDTDPDPEVLTRAPSGPVYSVFSPGMKRWIIAVVMLTSFISPMTAVSN